MDEFNSLISLQEDIDIDIDINNIDSSCNNSYPFLLHHHQHQHIIPTLQEQDLFINFSTSPPPNLLTNPILSNSNNNNNINHHLQFIKKGKKHRKPSSSSSSGAAVLQQEEYGINNNGSHDEDPANSNNNKHKRIVHRDIERQRRQEMANLYSSLRTLLPLEYIRGKRSICDQVNEAVNYIKYQEKNIKQLQSTRDKLRNSFETNNNSSIRHDDNPPVVVTAAVDMMIVSASSTKEEGNSSSSLSPPLAVEIDINPCSDGGLEILITNIIQVMGSSSSPSEVQSPPCPLSSVLQVLVELGLTVVSCFCTKVKDKFLYTIQTEANLNSTSTDFYTSVLPQKLSDKIRGPLNIKFSRGRGASSSPA